MRAALPLLVAALATGSLTLAAQARADDVRAAHLYPLRERLAEIVAPSIGSIDDSYENALAETVNGYYNAELIYGPARRQAVEDH